MLTKYIAAAAIVALSVVGTAWAFNTRADIQANDTSAAASVTAGPATVETDNCCLTGDCCCPGQGACCDPEAKAKALSSGVKYVKKAGAGCCATGNCCCPGQGSCCAVVSANAEAKSCCSAKSETKACCKK